MSTKFTDLLDACLIALSDSTAVTWPRTTTIADWCKEAMIAFPILRPMLDDHTNGASIVYSYALPSDFREVITVEYPTGNQPPTYLVKKNRLDPDFYSRSDFYDIDHDYTTGDGWYCYVSGGVAANAHIKMQYLANHKTNLADNDSDLITIADEYVHIIVAYVVMKAYRERLSKFMIDPTAHSSGIMQLTDMVRKAEENYVQLANSALQRLADSRITPNVGSDKYDRVY